MDDLTKDSATPDRGVVSLLGADRGGLQGAETNKGAGILDIPGNLVASGQVSSTTTGK